MGIFDKFKRKNKSDLLNIERTNVIDGIGYDKENNRKLVMLLADGMDWSDEQRHLMLLQEKLNNYIAYVESKQYSERYPNIEFIEIQIKFLFKETDNCKQFLEYAKKVVEDSLQNTTITIEYDIEDAY